MEEVDSRKVQRAAEKGTQAFFSQASDVRGVTDVLKHFLLG